MNTDLVERLRKLSERQELKPDASTVLEAATSIEELTAQARDKDYLIQQQADEIERLRRDVKKQQEKMFELAKGLPKKGKWSVQYDQDDKPLFRRKYVCSACGEWTSYGMSDYCPNCGAKMEVQE